jgi:hypothetical protein
VEDELVKSVFLARNSNEGAELASIKPGPVVICYRPWPGFWVSEGFIDGVCRCIYAGARMPREAIERAQRYLAHA